MRNNDQAIEGPKFVILASPGTARVGGSILGSSRRLISEESVRQGEIAETSTDLTIDIVLEHDDFADVPMCSDGYVNITAMASKPLSAEWCWSPQPFAPGIAAPPPPPPGDRCSPQQATGWETALAELPCSALDKLSSKHVQLTLPAYSIYDIETVETVSLTLRAAALKSNRTTLAYPEFAVAPTGGRVELEGDLLTSNEAAIRTGGSTLSVTLFDDAFVPNMDAATRRAVLHGISSSAIVSALRSRTPPRTLYPSPPPPPPPRLHPVLITTLRHLCRSSTAGIMW